MWRHVLVGMVLSWVAVVAMGEEVPNESVIRGASFGGAFERNETALLKRLKEPNGPSEIYALFGHAEYAGDSHGIVEVYTGGGGGEYWLRLDKDNGKTHSRQLTATEVEQLKVLAAKKIDELLPSEREGFAGRMFQYVHLTKDGGQRVFLNRPNGRTSGGAVHQEIVRQFGQWMNTGDFATRYGIQDTVKGVEVLWLGEGEGQLPLELVWAKGDDVRVRTKDGWRKFADGKLQAVVAVPTELNVTLWTGKRAPDDWRDREYGIFRHEPGKKPVRICEGRFDEKMIATPDGKWVLATSPQGDIYKDPDLLIRVEVATGKMTEVKMREMGAGRVGSYLPWAEKILVSWHKRDGKERPNYKEQTYWLVDAATGESELVAVMEGREGDGKDFGPLFVYNDWRPLQAVEGAGRENEMWAAKEDREKRETVVGRYDSKRFVFEPMLRLPVLRFSSMAMWVDGGWIYVVVNGDLLRVAIPSDLGSAGG